MESWSFVHASSRWAIALGAVGPTPLRASEAEAALGRRHVTRRGQTRRRPGRRAARPIDDIRASAAYRRAMVAVLARRGIEAVLSADSVNRLCASIAAVLDSSGGAA